MPSNSHSDGLSRRRFVQAAAGTIISAPFILTRTARASRVAPSERITLGFIGMGVMNRDHLGRFLSDEAVQVLAVCDVDTKRREHARKMVDDKYGAAGGSGCAAFGDHRELLARRDIDAVVVATPDHWHAIIVIDACRAGKDIYCEKPLSLTIHEAKAMIDAVRKHDRVFQTGSQQRTEFDGRFRKACEYVRGGRIGKVISVHVGVGESSKWCALPEETMEEGLDWDRWLGPAFMRPYNSVLSPRGVHTHYPMWRLYREYSGGMMTDFGAHHYDIAQWGLDMDASGPVQVHPPKDENAMTGARFVYGNGVEMYHGGPEGVTFIGDKGMIAVTRDRLNSIPEKILTEPLKDDDVHLPQWPNHHANWIECLKSRQRPICDVEVGARSVTCCHLANLVYWNRQSLRWDPQNWRFVGEGAPNEWLDYQRREPYRLPEA